MTDKGKFKIQIGFTSSTIQIELLAYSIDFYKHTLKNKTENANKFS